MCLGKATKQIVGEHKQGLITISVWFNQTINN